MQNKFIFYIFAKDFQMGPIRDCVNSSPKVIVSFAIRIWEGTEFFNFFFG